MRMIAKNAEKGKLSWAGYILQSIWRFSMLSARIISLVLLSLALREWTIVVMCKYNLNFDIRVNLNYILSNLCQRISNHNCISIFSCPLAVHDRMGRLPKYRFLSNSMGRKIIQCNCWCDILLCILQSQGRKITLSYHHLLCNYHFGKLCIFVHLQLDVGRSEYTRNK